MDKLFTYTYIPDTIREISKEIFEIDQTAGKINDISDLKKAIGGIKKKIKEDSFVTNVSNIVEKENQSMNQRASTSKLWEFKTIYQKKSTSALKTLPDSEIETPELGEGDGPLLDELNSAKVELNFFVFKINRRVISSL